MEIVILGSSSATPTLRRGLSSTAVLREGEVFLFDCGEGTQFRFMQAELPRRKFNHIFITHLHGDHVFGLGGFISSLNLGSRDTPLHVHGPKGVQRFLRAMLDTPKPARLGFELHFHEYPNGYVGEILDHPEYRVTARPLDHGMPTLGYRFQEKDRPGRFDSTLADELGIPFGPERGILTRGEPLELEDGRVIQPEAVVGPSRPGRSFAYITDTAMSPEAVALGRDTDLMLHEATFSDEDIELARNRKHSTMRQAALTARAAGAKRLVCTHFSTRYDHRSLERMAAQARRLFPKLIMAEDLLRISLEHS